MQSLDFICSSQQLGSEQCASLLYEEQGEGIWMKLNGKLSGESPTLVHGLDFSAQRIS